jgi:hypothetical protein
MYPPALVSEHAFLLSGMQSFSFNSWGQIKTLFLVKAGSCCFLEWCTTTFLVAFVVEVVPSFLPSVTHGSLGNTFAAAWRRGSFSYFSLWELMNNFAIGVAI